MNHGLYVSGFRIHARTEQYRRCHLDQPAHDHHQHSTDHHRRGAHGWTRCRAARSNRGRSRHRELFQGIPREFPQGYGTMDYFRRHGNWSRVFMGGVADHAAAHPQNRSDLGVDHRIRMGVGVAGALRELLWRSTGERVHLRRLAHWCHIGIGHDRRYLPRPARRLMGLHAAGPVPADSPGLRIGAHAACPILERVFAACVALSGTSDASAPSDTSDTTSPQRQ